jgi:hypothetical protein
MRTGRIHGHGHGHSDSDSDSHGHGHGQRFTSKHFAIFFIHLSSTFHSGNHHVQIL